MFSLTLREKDQEIKNDMLSCFFWILSSLDMSPGINAGILPENEANKWQRAEPRESEKRKSRTRDSTPITNSLLPMFLVKLGNLSQSFLLPEARGHH